MVQNNCYGSCNKGEKGEYIKLFERILKDGYTRVRVDGIGYDLSEETPALDKQKSIQLK